MTIEELGRQIVDASFQVHSTLGPGLLESSYEGCLVHELILRGISMESQVELPLIYKSHQIPVG